MVLLENNGVLPLASPCPVALFGSGARRTVKGGTGSGACSMSNPSIRTKSPLALFFASSGESS
jgi:hypothetical protein